MTGARCSTPWVPRWMARVARFRHGHFGRPRSPLSRSGGLGARFRIARNHRGGNEPGMGSPERSPDVPASRRSPVHICGTRTAARVGAELALFRGTAHPERLERSAARGRRHWLEWVDAAKHGGAVPPILPSAAASPKFASSVASPSATKVNSCTLTPAAGASPTPIPRTRCSKPPTGKAGHWRHSAFGKPTWSHIVQ